MATTTATSSNEHNHESNKRPIFGVLMDATNNNNSSANRQNNNSIDMMESTMISKPTAAPSSSKTTSATTGMHSKKNTSTTSASVSDDFLTSFLNNIELQFHQRLEVLKADLITGKQNQYEVLFSNMMKLPKPIRQMSVKEFNNTFHCNFLSDLSFDANVNTGTTNSSIGDNNANEKYNNMIPSVGFAPNSTSKKRDIMQLETPAPSKNRCHNINSTILPTPFRTVRRGEQLYSKNGSPVDPVEPGSVVATVLKKPRHNTNESSSTIPSSINETQTTNFDISVGEGKYISLNDPNNIQNLDSDMKQLAVLQLEALQDQMKTLMDQLKKPMV